MEGSSGFQVPMQAHYQPPPFQSQTPPLQGQPPPFQGQTPANNFTSQPPNKGSKTPKWTAEMVRLMITAISYIMEASTTEPYSDKSTHISKTTKWKVISTVMSEREHNVSPQQCENKFLEINKKYEQLIGLLGKSTSCKVFENPILLETIKMPKRKKEEVRKLLKSGHFLYREMCSLYHSNRLFLPHDWEVQRSVFGQVEEIEREVLRARWARLEEMKLEIAEKRLEFEKGRFEWLNLDHDEEMKIEKMRLENEKLKFENARLAFELKRKETVVGDGN